MNILLQIQPIMAALRKHKAAVVLLVCEIALTMAVLGNLVFIVAGNVARAHTPTGVAESQIGMIQSIGVIGKGESATAGENLAALRAVPGVADAAFGAPPLLQPGRVPVFLKAARQHPALHAYLFAGSQSYSRTLGLHVVQGHDFKKDALPTVEQVFGSGEAKPAVIPALITRHLARRLFGKTSALDRLFYDGNLNLRVIGVVDHLRGELTGSPGDDDSIVVEGLVGPEKLGGVFLIRAKDGKRTPQVLRAAAAAMHKINPSHVQAQLFTFHELRTLVFRASASADRMLVAIVVILLVVTGLGIGGLASFWVRERQRHIGVRRALGATRRDILRYFQAENFLIATIGVVLGAILAYVLNVLLMKHFEVARLPGAYVVIGAVVLWVLGQLAALGPALRASRVPPVVATRSV